MSEPKYATVDDTVWPINYSGAAWLLRYGPNHDYHLASVVDAYTALTDPNTPQYVAIEKLKRARRARAVEGSVYQYPPVPEIGDT